MCPADAPPALAAPPRHRPTRVRALERKDSRQELGIVVSMLSHHAPRLRARVGAS